jgi:hypothetical protein
MAVPRVVVRQPVRQPARKQTTAAPKPPKHHGHH